MIGKPFSEMSETELQAAADKIILKCSAFTGGEMPFTDFFASILSESIIDFLQRMGYAILNLNEIILSMEMNLSHAHKLPSGIELIQVDFSGRCVNLTFISKVLHNYMVVRNYLDRRFQNFMEGYE